jgi:hypothetical protein
MAVQDIDVSGYQSSTFPVSVKGLDVIFVKANEGTSCVNARRAVQARYSVERCTSVEGDPLFAGWEDPGMSCADEVELRR